ncbi:MAG: uroporphyrinogen decarboxylase family protein [Spirochaetia bacterium]
MTSRQRVYQAFAHRQPDQVPIDFSGHRSSGIAALSYAPLRARLGLPPRPVRVYDPIQQLAVVDDDVLERFGVDTVEMGRGFSLSDSDWQEWTLPDGTPCLMPAWVNLERRSGEWIMKSKAGAVLGRMPDGALYFEQVNFPFIDGDDLTGLGRAFEECMWTSGDAAAPPGPADTGPNGSRKLAEGAARLRASCGDRAVIGLFGGNLLETGQFMYRNDNFFMLLAGEPDRAAAFLDKAVELHLENLKKFLAAVGDSLDIILFGDDLGMQTGPQISPQMYRTLFKPRHKLMWETAKKLAPAGRGGDPNRPPVRVMLHCCGSIRALLPDLIDAGLEAVNPVQISTAGMEASGLKRDFGRDIVLWGGGCDTQSVLRSGTPAEVRDHVRRQVGMLSPDGGFVFQQVHNILAGVPPENIVAMFDAVRA